MDITVPACYYIIFKFRVDALPIHINTILLSWRLWTPWKKHTLYIDLKDVAQLLPSHCFILCPTFCLSPQFLLNADAFTLLRALGLIPLLVCSFCHGSICQAIFALFSTLTLRLYRSEWGVVEGMQGTMDRTTIDDYLRTLIIIGNWNL